MNQKYNYFVYEVYYPDDWIILRSFSTLEEALQYKSELQSKAKNTMYDYVVVVSDF